MQCIRVVALISAIFALSGCYRYQGSPGIISPSGIVNWTKDTANKSTDLKENFAHYAKDSASNPDDTVKSSEMLESGFLLVNANCDNYFTLMGKDQRGLRIARDAIAPIVTVLTGVVSLVRFQGGEGEADRYLQALSLGSGLATSGLDIYETHFLFGANNIHEVRELTFKALAAHRDAVAKLGDLHFAEGAMQLIDHQVICTPASILALTKQAIAAGEVTSTGGASVATKDDEQALKKLGSIFDLPGMATADQAGALWWLYRGDASDNSQTIGEMLKGLGDASPFKANDEHKWIYSGISTVERDEVLDALASLSPQTKASFEETLQKYRSEKASGAPPKFTLGGGAGKINLKVN